jgi:hypothetical protein
VPVPLLVAIVVVAALLLALIVVRVLGRDPSSRLHAARASSTEAGERTSDLAAEFFDWLRIGR